jgi:ribosomal protein L40E
MDFLESLFELGSRKNRKNGGFFQNGNQHHYDDHDDDHAHHQHPTNTYPQNPANYPADLSGGICRNCSTQTIQGAKFCHRCGSAIEMVLNCASCGSILPVNSLFCPQCGYKNG